MTAPGHSSDRSIFYHPLAPEEQVKLLEEVEFAERRWKAIFPANKSIQEILPDIYAAASVFGADPKAAVARLRGILEPILREVYSSEMNELPKGDALMPLCEKLFHNTPVPEYATGLMASVIVFGNMGAHPKQKARKDPSHLGYNEFKSNLCAMLGLVEWYLIWKQAKLWMTPTSAKWRQVMETANVCTGLRLMLHGTDAGLYRGVLLDRGPELGSDTVRQEERVRIEIDVSALESFDTSIVVSDANVAILVIDDKSVICLKPSPRLAPSAIVRRPITYIPDPDVTNRPLAFAGVMGDHVLVALFSRHPLPPKLLEALEAPQPRSLLDGVAAYLDWLNPEEWSAFYRQFNVV